MVASAHLTVLKSKHTKLEQQIKKEMKSPHPDTLRISSLKKQKLQIKDQLLAQGAA